MDSDDVSRTSENAGVEVRPGELMAQDPSQPTTIESSSSEPSSNQTKRRLIIVGVYALVGALVISNVLLWTSLNSTKSDLKTAQTKVNRLESVAGSAFKDVADRVLAIETELGDVGSGSEDASARVDDVEGALDELYSCVNAFLEGFDAANGGYFTYDFC